MADAGTLNIRVVVVSGPTSLPEDMTHEDAVAMLASTSAGVILFQHGDDKYNLRPDFELPYNVRLVDYSYETLDDALQRLKTILNKYDIDVIGREEQTPLPFVLSGSVVRVPLHTELAVFNGKIVKKDLDKQPVITAKELLN